MIWVDDSVKRRRAEIAFAEQTLGKATETTNATVTVLVRPNVARVVVNVVTCGRSSYSPHPANIISPLF